MRRHGERWPDDMARHRGQWEDSMLPVFDWFAIPRSRPDRWQLLAFALAYEHRRDLLEPEAKRRGGRRKAPSEHTAAQERIYRACLRHIERRSKGLSRRAAALNFFNQHSDECKAVRIRAVKTLENGMRDVLAADAMRATLIRFGRRRSLSLIKPL
jgi:hypothetical protein